MKKELYFIICIVFFFSHFACSAQTDEFDISLSIRGDIGDAGREFLFIKK
ncbi:MAG: hypothetical protein PF450_01720 [Bacteroidales bacterium]|nr:hypothetical protein [Bacteroidales bacterium]